MTNRPAWRQVERPDGARLEVLSDEGSKLPLLFHCGTPGAAVWFESLAAAAGRAGLRLVTYSRPGYAASTARRGRSVGEGRVDRRVR